MIDSPGSFTFVQVTITVQLDVPALLMFKGVTPLHVAVAYAPCCHNEIVALLLKNGADPNFAAGRLGIVPAYAAAVTHNEDGLCALILQAGFELDINKGNSFTHSTPLMGTS